MSDIVNYRKAIILLIPGKSRNLVSEVNMEVLML